MNDIAGAVRTIEKIGEAYDGDASFIIYYAGHGIPNEANGDSYLLPTDGDGSDYETGYSVNKLYTRVGAVPSRNTVIFLDACFSGALRGDGMLVAARGVAIKAKPTSPLGNMVVFSAAQGDETAWPYKEKGHGMFSYFLMKKLQESKGNATLAELSDYISTQVSRRSIVDNGKSQTPAVSVSSSLGDKWQSWKLK